MVALTLPEEVLDALRRVHPDPGWAIVQLVEGFLDRDREESPERPDKPPAELVHLPGGRSLIVVDPRLFRGLEGVSTIPLSDGGAFLALDHGGLADLEVALTDCLETLGGTPEHDRLCEVRDIVRAWRRDRSLVFRTKSIIVAEGATGGEPRLLAPLGASTRTTARRTRGRVG